MSECNTSMTKKPDFDRTADDLDTVCGRVIDDLCVSCARDSHTRIKYLRKCLQSMSTICDQVESAYDSKLIADLLADRDNPVSVRERYYKRCYKRVWR